MFIYIFKNVLNDFSAMCLGEKRINDGLVEKVSDLTIEGSWKISPKKRWLKVIREDMSANQVKQSTMFIVYRCGK